MGVQEQASACFLRGLVPRPSGTALYGAVRRVVWDPWLALAVSHGDPIRLFGLLVKAPLSFILLNSCVGHHPLELTHSFRGNLAASAELNPLKVLHASKAENIGVRHFTSPQIKLLKPLHPSQARQALSGHARASQKP